MVIAAFRFNNPFDVSLPIAGWSGGGSIAGIQGQSGFASFPNMSTGYAAGVQRLNSYITGQSSYGPLTTINQLNSVYATDPNWAAGVSRFSGIGPNTPLDVNNASQMSQLQYGVLAQELGPANANTVFSNYGQAPQAPDIFTTGTGEVPFTGTSDTGANSVQIGGLGDTSGMSSTFPQVGSGTSEFGQFNAAGQFQDLNAGGAINGDVSSLSTAQFGGAQTFGTAGVGGFSPTDAGLVNASGGASGGIDSNAFGGSLSGGIDTGNGSVSGIGGGAAGFGSDIAGADTGFSGADASTNLPSQDIASGVGGILGSISQQMTGQAGGDSTFFTWLGDWAIRGGIIMLGFVFVAGALLLFAFAKVDMNKVSKTIATVAK